MAGETSHEFRIVELADGVFVAVPAPQAHAASSAPRSRRPRVRRAALALIPGATVVAAWLALHPA
jgi:hypothetical protein